VTCPSTPCDHIDLLAALWKSGINPNGPRDYHDPELMAWGEVLADRRADQGRGVVGRG